MNDEELLLADESYALRGAFFDVYKELGTGFSEPVYQESLKHELSLRSIVFIAKPRLEVYYKNQKLESEYEPDFLCFEQIIVELKAVRELADEHRAQVHNYLKITKHRLGLLVNFGHYPLIQIERIVR